MHISNTDTYILVSQPPFTDRSLIVVKSQLFYVLENHYLEEIDCDVILSYFNN